MRSSFNYASRRFFRSCLLAAFAGAGVSGLAIAQEGEPPRAKLERGMALGTAPAGHPAHGLAPAEGAPDLCPMGDACFDLAIGYVTGRVRNPAFAESDPRGFDQVKLRGYLGEVVEFGGQRPFMAPVVELAPGDTFRLTLQNELPAWASAGDIDVLLQLSGARSAFPERLMLLLKGVWKDTVFTPQGQLVQFRTRYERYIGDFVLHCHILDHEDQGMMQNVRIGLADGKGGFDIPMTEGHAP